MQLFRVLVASVCLASAAALLPAAPAAADARTFEDRADDARRGLDIREVRVVHDERLIVRARFDYVARHKPRSWTVYFDTRRRDSGPEFAVSGGLRTDTDWQVFRVEGWRDPTAQVLTRCDSDMRIRFGFRGVATFEFAPRCFNRPFSVRVAVRSDGRGGAGDWAPRPYRLFGAVDRGRASG
ncbi:MAG: hypothetical protein H0U77_01325 [Nocardioidaceae bacterium]|nr:hypothetical protein [Nocardioidaceae bacterium]